MEKENKVLTYATAFALKSIYKSLIKASEASIVPKV